jgi:preprotein translocase subunit SecG
MGIYIFVSVLVLVACAFQILIVLVQNSKGGGLAANFTSAGQTMGIRKTADFLEKATWTLAAAILILSLVATATIPKKTREANPRTSLDNAVNPGDIPALPQAVPPASTTTSTGNNQPSK